LPADLDAILALQQSVPECAQWTRATYATIFTASPDSNPQRAVFCAWRDRRLQGFAVVSRLRTVQAAECELENMAVASADRRQGIGRRLVGAVLAWSLEQQAGRVHLEVRASNVAAVRLYEQLGFVAVGRRPAYYSQPVEDAVQMTWIAGAVRDSAC
jgi:ribosomal-protein-alanine N-acetyltransferase